MDLLRDLIRARALEDLLARSGPSGGERAAPRPVSPAVPAARALRRATDGSGDVFSLRVGSPAAALVMGAAPEEVIRQRLGKASAPAGGRDGGGFPTDLHRGLLGPVALPGTLVEVISGVGFAFQMRGEDRVALLVDDLPGSGSGDWHEGLNFAAVRRVPMVLVVDRSGKAPAGAAAPSMAERAPAYGFAVHAAAGTDPRNVEQVTAAAVDAARRGEGLQVVEVDTPDRDPVAWLLQTAVDAGELGAADADALVRSAGAEMAAALARVESEPDPSPSAP